MFALLTPKGHLVLDLVKHVLLDPGNPAKPRETPQAGQQSSRTSAVETAVKAIKKTMRRLRNDNTELDARLCGHVAAAAHNQTESVKGFSPIQWAFGSNPAAWRLEKLTRWRSTSTRVRS